LPIEKRLKKHRLEGEVEGGERFVQQQEFGLTDEGAGESDALLLASGDGGGTAGSKRRDTEAFENFIHAGIALVGREIEESVFDIAADGEMREEGRLLREVSDAALADGDVLSGFTGEESALAKRDAAAGRTAESGDAVKHGGFTGSRGAEEDDRFTLGLEAAIE
jgi:hypothetical protein